MRRWTKRRTGCFTYKKEKMRKLKKELRLFEILEWFMMAETTRTWTERRLFGSCPNDLVRQILKNIPENYYTWRDCKCDDRWNVLWMYLYLTEDAFEKEGSPAIKPQEKMRELKRKINYFKLEWNTAILYRTRDEASFYYDIPDVRCREQLKGIPKNYYTWRDVRHNKEGEPHWLILYLTEDAYEPQIIDTHRIALYLKGQFPPYYKPYSKMKFLDILVSIDIPNHDLWKVIDSEDFFNMWLDKVKSNWVHKLSKLIQQLNVPEDVFKLAINGEVQNKTTWLKINHKKLLICNQL